MGQYFKFIILSENNEILLSLNPHDFYEGAKLMENAWVDSLIANTIEFLLSPYCEEFHKSRCVMAGDYADDNLFNLANGTSHPQAYKNININYIVNHTKKLYVDKKKLKKNNCNNIIHPLLLLIAEGNGRGGGDYHGTNEDLVGTWSRDVISMEFEKPIGYSQFVCNFNEE